MGGSRLDRSHDFQKFCGSGLDWIQFCRIRTGLGLKNFTQSAHLCCRVHDTSCTVNLFEWELSIPALQAVVSSILTNVSLALLLEMTLLMGAL